MSLAWQFRAVRTPAKNVILGWLGRDKVLQARLDSCLRRLRKMATPWPMPYYRPLGDGIGEVRFDLRNVEHRLYGYFGPGPNDFTVVLASSGKKGQNKRIKAAKRLKRQYEMAAPELENYDV